MVIWNQTGSPSHTQTHSATVSRSPVQTSPSSKSSGEVVLEAEEPSISTGVTAVRRDQAAVTEVSWLPDGRHWHNKDTHVFKVRLVSQKHLKTKGFWTPRATQIKREKFPINGRRSGTPWYLMIELCEKRQRSDLSVSRYVWGNWLVKSRLVHSCYWRH